MPEPEQTETLATPAEPHMVRSRFGASSRWLVALAAALLIIILAGWLRTGSESEPDEAVVFVLHKHNVILFRGLILPGILLLLILIGFLMIGSRSIVSLILGGVLAAAPLLFAVEYRRLETTYADAVYDLQTANHVNLALGFEF